MLSILVAVVIAANVPAQGPTDAEPVPAPPAASTLDSLELEAKALAAMLLPYRYGVTQMPCRALEWQPQRGWYPAREPSGRIAWVIGPATRVRWSGIYGTCFIDSPVTRQEVPEIERTALECECNGWLPSR